MSNTMHGGRSRRRTRMAIWSLAALVVVAAACAPMAPPTDGVDLSVAVSDNVEATIGSSVTYDATVSSVGTAATTGPVAATVVVPPGQTVTAAAGTGWTCTNDDAQATCRIDDADVQPGQALPKISVTADVAGPTLIAQVYVAISSEGDVNPANDEALGKVTVTPAIEGDQLFVQVAGALSMRNGGTVSSGDVSITADPAGSLGGADRLQIDASVGSTHVLADLQRTNLTLFTGTITVTDPALQGGVPLTVDWRGPVFSYGLAPWRSLGSELLGLKIPSLDASGVTGALANGLTYTLNFSAADYAPEAPAAGQPPISYFGNNPSNLIPTLNPPSRVVAGAEVTLPVEISPRGGSTVGPVAATVDLPPGLEYVRAGNGSTCTSLPAVQRRLRCTLDSSIAEPLRPNLLAGLAGVVLPVPTQSIDLRVRATTPGVPLTVSATVGSANSASRSTDTTINASPPGPEVGLTMNGAELTPNLYFREGTGLSANQYSFAVDNVGTATSASPTVTVTLPEGVSYRGFTNPTIQQGNNRFICSAAAQEVTCTRSNGVGVTSLTTPASTFAIQVNVTAPTSPTVTATAALTNSNDVNPGGPDKSATATTRVAATGAPTYDVALSNGAFTATARPVLEGGYTFATTPGGRVDGINGCGTSMNYVPPVLVLPVVGPTLVPAIFADNTLCVDINRVPGTNNFAGTVRTDFVTAPVFLPPPVPQDLPLPPVIGPREVSVDANQNVTLTGLLGGAVSGSADGSSLQLVLNGGTDFTTSWSLTAPPEATCIDINSCP